MKKLLILITILCSFKIVKSQDFSVLNAKDDYSIKLIDSRKYDIGTPDYQRIADSITNILDSIGYYRYQIEFKNKENRFLYEYQKLLSLNPQNTDSTSRILIELSNESNYYFYFVKKYSKDIIPYCFDYKNNRIHCDMLCMLDIPKELKDSLLTYNYCNVKWFLWQRISLGDTIVENDIIAKYKEAVNNLKKYDDIYDILYFGRILLASGSLKSLKAYISAFDCNKVVEKTKGVYITSLLHHLIADHKIFFNYYPQYCIFSSVYFICHTDDYNKRSRGIVMLEYEKSYVKQIEKLCLDEFDIKLHINLPFFRMYDYQYFYSKSELYYWLWNLNIDFYLLSE